MIHMGIRHLPLCIHQANARVTEAELLYLVEHSNLTSLRIGKWAHLDLNIQNIQNIQNMENMELSAYPMPYAYAPEDLLQLGLEDMRVCEVLLARQADRLQSIRAATGQPDEDTDKGMGGWWVTVDKLRAASRNPLFEVTLL
jgi:hypothetical protein